MTENKQTAVMNLSQAKVGEEFKIIKVAGNSMLKRRLMEMGLIKGATLKVEKYAPLRDPLELVIKGMHLSLRVDEAENVLVEKL